MTRLVSRLSAGVWLTAALVVGSVAHAEPTPTTPLTSGARVDDPAFEAVLRPAGSYRVGQAGHVELVLVAKGKYKINDEYPYKFTFTMASGIEPHADVVNKEAMVIQGQRGVMKLKFTPTASGKSTLGGEFKFSVCTDDRCLVEKRELSLTLDVD